MVIIEYRVLGNQESAVSRGGSGASATKNEDARAQERPAYSGVKTSGCFWSPGGREGTVH